MATTRSVLCLCAVFAASYCVSVLRAGEHAITGVYETMALPTEAENAALQRMAKHHGIDFLTALHEMTEDDLQTWTKVFAISMDFREYDRSAQVYGYHLFTSWLYFVASCGVDKYSKLLDAQPTEVRQRVRDFIYLDAALAPQGSRKQAENELRVKCPSLFPNDYVFGNGNDVFKSTIRRTN